MGPCPPLDGRRILVVADDATTAHLIRKRLGQRWSALPEILSKRAAYWMAVASKPRSLTFI